MRSWCAGQAVLPLWGPILWRKLVGLLTPVPNLCRSMRGAGSRHLRGPVQWAVGPQPGAHLLPGQPPAVPAALAATTPSLSAATSSFAAPSWVGTTDAALLPLLLPKFQEPLVANAG